MCRIWSAASCVVCVSFLLFFLTIVPCIFNAEIECFSLLVWNTNKIKKRFFSEFYYTRSRSSLASNNEFGKPFSVPQNHSRKRTCFFHLWSKTSKTRKSIAKKNSSTLTLLNNSSCSKILVIWKIRQHYIAHQVTDQISRSKRNILGFICCLTILHWNCKCDTVNLRGK